HSAPSTPTHTLSLHDALPISAARDLATEIEWAKSSLVEPSEYVVAAGKAQRETAWDPATVAAVYTAYEQIKRSRGVIDFEDLLRDRKSTRLNSSHVKISYAVF